MRPVHELAADLVAHNLSPLVGRQVSGAEVLHARGRFMVAALDGKAPEGVANDLLPLGDLIYVGLREALRMLRRLHEFGDLFRRHDGAHARLHLASRAAMAHDPEAAARLCERLAPIVHLSATRPVAPAGPVLVADSADLPYHSPADAAGALTPRFRAAA
jgi:hypothetical protein